MRGRGDVGLRYSEETRLISILILTRNEQLDLPGCLASVQWSDDIHVFDSYSVDGTVQLAKEAGAIVHERVFDDYATHRNAALDSIPFRHTWVFLLDADERPRKELCEEMRRVVVGASVEVGGFTVRRRDYLFGTWLKHAQISPVYLRLVRHAQARYTRAINEVIQVSGVVQTLEGPLDHYPFSKGIGHWVRKHDVYSTMEAELIFREQGLKDPSWRIALTSKDLLERRLHQKAIFYRLPARPLIKWIYMMLVRGAVLDGAAGVTYATLQSFYEYLIVLKTKELRRGGA